MTTTKGSKPFATAAADEGSLEATIVALEARGFGVEVVEDSDAAGVTVLACSRGRASVMTNPSVTLAKPVSHTGSTRAATTNAGRHETFARYFGILVIASASPVGSPPTRGVRRGHLRHASAQARPRSRRCAQVNP